MALTSNRRNIWTTLLVGAAVLALAGPACAQWAWKDDNGRTVYSDRPPPATVKTDRIVRQPSNSQTVLPPQQAGVDGAPRSTEPTKSASASNAPKTVAEQEMEFRKRQIERAEAEKKAKEDETKSAAKAAECERAKGYLKAIEDGQRLARTDASGNREYLDDTQRAAEADRARKVMQASCSS